MIEINGHPGYFICKTGEVYSNKSKNGRGGKTEIRVLKKRINDAGYYVVGLCIGKQSKVKIFTIHKLLALHYIENPENKPIINHIDGNKLNNNLSNLEWCTHKENAIHAYKNGLSKGPPINKFKGESHPQSKLNESDVLNIREEYKKGNCSQRYLAKKYNVKQSTIWSILNKKLWSHL